MSPARAFTVVSFHAHPDDEALLTGGTLARAAADGHRVVLVVATSGEAGLTSGDDGAGELRRRRRRELEASAAAIGAARCVVLPYPDSGYGRGGRAGSAGRVFSALDPAPVARELADLLVAESADVLTSYDAAGGYGHPDHVQVHRVGALAAGWAQTPLVLEATIDRRLLRMATAPLRLASHVVAMPELPDFRSAFTPAAQITHRVDVGAHLDAKLAALAAHASQAEVDDGRRTLALLLGLPPWLRRRVLGTEWFRDPDPGRRGVGRAGDDIFETLRDRHSV